MYTRFFLIPLLFIVASSLQGASRDYLKYSGTTFDLSSVCAKIKLFKDLKTKPLGSIETHRLTRSRGSKTWQIETYFPKDLWVRDELAGTWFNDICTVSIYKISLPFPKDLNATWETNNQKYVTKEEYAKWKQEIETEKIEWTDDKIAEWLHNMTGQKIQSKPEELKRGGPTKATTKIFKSESKTDSDFIYVITREDLLEEPIVFRYELQTSQDDYQKKKNIKAIETSLGSISFYKSKRTPTKSQKKEFSSIKKLSKKSPEYIASRDAVIKSIQNLPDWWYIETDNFVMVANIKNKKTALDLAKNLEKVRNVYIQYYPIKAPLKAVSVARMFKTRDEYVNFVGEGHKWSGGIWMSSKKELAVSPMDWGSRSERRKMMIETTFHEAFHQFIYFATGKKGTSSWFNEGNAQYFEEIDFRGDKFTIGLEERNARIMPQLATSSKIKKLINISHYDFYKSDRSNNYSLAYGIMFFLQKGAPLIRNENNYHEIPMRYYEAVLEKTPEEANKIAWEGVDMEQFAKDFKEFWESSSLVKRAQRYNPLKDKK